ncbi:hypothetical protein [Gemmatimonas sp.]|uniref:hypothetical protein n=1 Tax=Gemmatimonas sp. TaxID=1962908 RepID=UPI00286DA9D6|nr:hypothetical protein [Gemmatimonas sp.]
MSTIAHALHLVRFDLLRVRWWIALYAIALTVSIAVGLELIAIPALEFLLPHIVVAIGMITAVTLVQIDTPIRREGFAIGHAVSPRGMLLAKAMSILLLLVLLPIVAAGFALAARGLQSTLIASVLGESVRNWVTWIAIASLVAASTRGFRSGALLFVGTILATLLIGSAWSGFGFELTSQFARLAMPMNALAMAALIALVFLRKVSGRWLLVLTSLVMLWSTLTSFGSAVSTPHSTRPISSLPSFEIEIVNYDVFGESSALKLPAIRASIAQQPAGGRYALRSAHLTAFSADGDSVRVRLSGRVDVDDTRSAIPLREGTKWKGESSINTGHSARLIIDPTDVVYGAVATIDARGKKVFVPKLARPSEQLRRLQTETVTNIRVDATLDHFAPIELATAPFNDGAFVEQGFRRFSMVKKPMSADYDASFSDVVRPEDLDNVQVVQGKLGTPLMLVLQSASTREAVLLGESSSSETRQSVILPGIQRRVVALTAQTRDAVSGPVDDEWLSGATVRLVSWKRDGVAVVHGAKNFGSAIYT